MLIAFFLSLILSFSPPPALQIGNTIEGRVTGPNNRPLQNVRVLLQDDSYGQLQMAYTDGAGRFRFNGVNRGVYNIQVEPGQYPYERQSQRLEVNPFRGREIFRAEFALQPAKGAAGTVEPAGSVFAQPVPEAAKKEYLRALKSLDKDAFEEAEQALKSAISLFPDYYDALELLGTEYVKRKNYKEALTVLPKAVEVNKDSWRGYYSLGVAQSESNMHDESVKALKRAVELNPASINAHMRLGMELARDTQALNESIQELKKVTQMAGNSVPEAYFYLGALYNKTNQYREAADAFEAFLKAAPQAGEREKIKEIIKQLREKSGKK